MKVWGRASSPVQWQRSRSTIARHTYRGELDLVGWQGDVLCFIEVKTRSAREVKPAQAAVDGAEQRELARALEFVRHLARPCQWNFDVRATYYDLDRSRPAFQLFQNAFSLSYNR